jgi:hypothetical protein
MDEKQIAVLRFGTAFFFFLFAIVAYFLMQQMFQIATVERDVKAKYAEILQNYSCVPLIHGVNLPPVDSCIVMGYFYPVCPREMNGSIFNFTLVRK